MTAKPLSQRQFNTILAALRFWQRDLSPGYIPDALLKIARDGDIEELSTGEIDELCKVINCGELHVGEP